MRLTDASGAYLDLRIEDYQFPGAVPVPDGNAASVSPGWDGNWLIIRGSVRTAVGMSWSFRQPMLTTWEVADATEWLRRVADGTVPAVTAVEERRTAGVPLGAPDDADESDRRGRAGWLTFTEPNLSLGVAGYDGQRVRLLVGLGHESAEPPVDPRWPAWSSIDITMGRQQVADAAAALEQELAAHPAR